MRPKKRPGGKIEEKKKNSAKGSKSSKSGCNWFFWVLQAFVHVKKTRQSPRKKKKTGFEGQRKNNCVR